MEVQVPPGTMGGRVAKMSVKSLKLFTNFSPYFDVISKNVPTSIYEI